MNASDNFSACYAELLEGRYDCADRMVLNAYHPPFGAQIILDGHEWVEQQALKRHISVAKSSNCFIEGSDFEAVGRMANKLQDEWRASIPITPATAM